MAQRTDMAAEESWERMTGAGKGDHTRPFDRRKWEKGWERLERQGFGKQNRRKKDV